MKRLVWNLSRNFKYRAQNRNYLLSEALSLAVFLGATGANFPTTISFSGG